VTGNLTIEATLGLSNFVRTDVSNRASTNYAIGTDGRIGLGVEETMRAWTSSSSANDREAITFEIANTGGKATGWAMSDAALNAWLDLAIDIAVFYGFSKIAYYGNKDAQGEDDEMIITLHRWFTNKDCPGDYFVARIPEMVIELNYRLAGGTPNKFVNGRIAQINSSPLQPAPAPRSPIIDSPETKPSEFEPYRIRISTTALNVRSGPGVGSPVAKRSDGSNLVLRNDPNIYTIIEEADAPIDTKGTMGRWGRLKSGAGWVALHLTRRI